jgi:hypothetical protein
MGKFKRVGRGIPSNMHKRKRRPFTRDEEKTKRSGQVAHLGIDVVPFLKWMYADGGISYKNIERITGVGIRTVRRLVSLTDADPPLQICEVCLKVAYKYETFCSQVCYRTVHPKVKSNEPRKLRTTMPCVHNLSCGGSVLKTSQHGLCTKCREKLPERKVDRHAKAIERAALRAQGLLPPKVVKYCDRCNAKVAHNNTTGLCRACKNA